VHGLPIFNGLTARHVSARGRPTLTYVLPSRRVPVSALVVISLVATIGGPSLGNQQVSNNHNDY